MSRTRRAVPDWAKGDFAKTIERGHTSMPKLEFEGVDDVWGQGGKKHRKRMISRKRRRDNSCTKDQYEH